MTKAGRGRCELCLRDDVERTIHHLPRENLVEVLKIHQNCVFLAINKFTLFIQMPNWL